MEDWKTDRVGSAERGENPTVLARMRTGFAVIGDTQFLPGYCVLLAYPRVKHLNDLDLQRRSEFLLDMSILGDAITQVCSPRRLNYAIQGNTDDFLHAHVFPRYDWENEKFIRYPIWEYVREMWSDWNAPENQWSNEKYADLVTQLKITLAKLMDEAYQVNA